MHADVFLCVARHTLESAITSHMRPVDDRPVGRRLPVSAHCQEPSGLGRVARMEPVPLLPGIPLTCSGPSPCPQYQTRPALRCASARSPRPARGRGDSARARTCMRRALVALRMKSPEPVCEMCAHGSCPLHYVLAGPGRDILGWLPGGQAAHDGSARARWCARRCERSSRYARRFPNPPGKCARAAHSRCLMFLCLRRTRPNHARLAPS
jgi:hypothetical protein